MGTCQLCTWRTGWWVSCGRTIIPDGWIISHQTCPVFSVLSMSPSPCPHNSMHLDKITCYHPELQRIKSILPRYRWGPELCFRTPIVRCWEWVWTSNKCVQCGQWGVWIISDINSVVGDGLDGSHYFGTLFTFTRICLSTASTISHQLTLSLVERVAAPWGVQPAEDLITGRHGGCSGPYICLWQS